MVLPIDHHDILIQGVLPYMYKAQGKLQESASEKQEYIRQRDNAVRELADRNLSPAHLDYPHERELPAETYTIILD